LERLAARGRTRDVRVAQLNDPIATEARLVAAVNHLNIECAETLHH
jgi:hypothetical protein